MQRKEKIKIDHGHHQHKKKRPELDAVHVNYERTESDTDSNRFFKRIDNENKGIKQEVNITVNVEQPKDDCLTSCFSAIGSCFGKGAKGASS